MDQKKHILLISYVFPPYYGIGGRRWAKFAKYLTRRGFVVHVVCAENPFESPSLFLNDIHNNPDIILYPLPPSYPQILNTKPKTFFQKLSYRFWSQFLPYRINGTIYDKAIFWKEKMLSKAEHIVITHSIHQIIITGAPFRTNFYGADLKKKFPAIHFINDFRDPWSWSTSYGYPQLPASKFENELTMEKTVLEYTDLLTVPSAAMQEHLQKKYPESADKIRVLPHGVDTDEVVQEPKTHETSTRILFYGTLYDDIDARIMHLAKVLKSHADVKLDLFTSGTKYAGIFQEQGLLNKQVFYHSTLPPKELFQKFKDYQYAVILQPDYAADYISTKFYEIIHTGTPIIYIGKQGLNAEFIQTNQLGVFIPSDDIVTTLGHFLSNRREYTFKPMNVKEYTYSHVTDQLIDWMSGI